MERMDIVLFKILGEKGSNAKYKDFSQNLYILRLTPFPF